MTAIEGPRTWHYGGKLHRVPEGYRLLTKISLQAVHQLWYDGIQIQKICPFRLLDGKDVHKDDRKHLSSAKALVAEIDKFLPVGFRDSCSSDRDAAFKLAFDAMASSFEITIEDLTPKRKALEITAYTTLYTKFYLPSKKKRDSHSI